MADSNVTKEDISLAPAARPAKDTAPAPEKSHEPELPDCQTKKRSAGNKIFDWLVYSSIAWAGVSAVSLLTANEANHGTSKYFNWLRSLNKATSNGVKRVLSGTIMKNSPPEKVDAWAKGTALYYMLGFGGTSLTWLIKYLEDNRLKLSAKIDRVLGTTPPDSELMAKEPKQTWRSVLSGRAFSVLAIGFPSFVIMGPEKAEKISNWFGNHGTNIMMKFRPKANEAVVRKWMNLGAFDVMMTAITASATYAFSRFVAKKNSQSLDAEDALLTIDPVTPTPFNPQITKTAEKHYPAVKPRAPIAKPEALYSQQVAAEAEQANLAPRSL